MELNDIEHRTTKVANPRTNGFVERFNRTVLDAFFRTALPPPPIVAFKLHVLAKTGPMKIWLVKKSPTNDKNVKIEDNVRI